MSLVHQFLREVGLTVGPSVSLVSEILFKGDQWLNKEGPLQQSWRNTDRLHLVLFYTVHIHISLLLRYTWYVSNKD